MKRMKKLVLACMVLCLVAIVCAGCEDNPVMRLILSNEEFATQEAVENAEQPATVNADENVYASVDFIESLKGTRYTASWLLDGKLLTSTQKETKQDQTDVVVYTLAAADVKPGTLKIQITHQDELIFTKEVEVK